MDLVFDVEASGSQRNKAHPYDVRNKMCNIGFFDIDNNNKKIWKIEYDDEPYGQCLQEIQKYLDECTTLIGANIKYDIAWLRRYGLRINPRTRVFDIQLAYYILGAQTESYPSVAGMSEHYGIEGKLDVVKEEYWDKGLDTDEVPYPILCEYLEQDLEVTKQLADILRDEVKNSPFKMQKLISVSMQDLIVLQDIEHNGLLYNVDKSMKKGDELVREIGVIDEWLKKVFGASWFNPNSGDQLSMFLYGGTVELDGKEEYTFHYKDGRTAQKIRNTKIPFVSKGLFVPLPRTELAKEGFYSTNEGTLIKLAKTAKGEGKKIINTILHRAKLEKRRSTYYHGYPKVIQKMGWYDDDIIHSNFNQCVAASGRLSSTKPNVQNIEGKVNEAFITRF